MFSPSNVLKIKDEYEQMSLTAALARLTNIPHFVTHKKINTHMKPYTLVVALDNAFLYSNLLNAELSTEK